MADIDRRTGKPIDNYASALQSVETIFTTRLGERVMLREFGAGLVELLGRLMTPVLFGTFRTIMAASIDLWEPRFRVRRVDLQGSIDDIRRGRTGFVVEVDWRPRGHLGDDTVEGVRTFGLAFVSGEARATTQPNMN
ncbi:GPW/gp25 family protein [Roseinatronobacter sp.]